MPVMTDILNWSVGRPAWQRDALRRIVTQVNLSEQDISELTRMCLSEHNITDEENPAPVPNPLAREHLPLEEGIVERVQLKGLRDIQGVNALATDQQINFELNGMTIVFGYNGSGKSGYARVLRSLCHARSRGDNILQNVYLEGEQPNPSAIIEYRIGEFDHSETWQQGHTSPEGLKQISYFDTDCAVVHVNEDNELAFTPFGLDILPKLVNVCQRVSTSISLMITESERIKPPSLINPQASEGTVVRTLLDMLDANSNISVFQKLAALSERDLERIVLIQESLGTDSSSIARDLHNKAIRLLRLHSNIKGAAELLSIESINRIQSKLDDFITKKETAKVAADEAFNNQQLSGVGNDVWQNLWEAARRYSQQDAYPAERFPYVGDDARCVLCQQLLDPDAKERLTAFETFIKAETQQLADEAKVELINAINVVQRLTVGKTAFLENLNDLTDDQHDLKQLIRQFHIAAWRIRKRVLHSCVNGHWDVPFELSESPETILNELVQNIVRRAAELERVAVDGERETLIRELSELLGRQWLSTILEDVDREVTRQKILASLNNAINETNTTGITRRSSELTDTYVTEVLRDKLNQEIRNLGAEHLRVELISPGGRYGQRRFKISLHGASDRVDISKVLSEGEFRCIALAGFLSELSTEQSGSALVFDDPVCSLDHQWRRKVAFRLVQIAGERQVIVFTHDIVFLVNLVGYCETHTINLRQCYLYRRDNQSGECIDGLPWAAMKINNKIRFLKNKLQDAEAIFRHDDIQSYEIEAHRIYHLLRNAWERAVEEVLLNGVVVRFDDAIHTQQLRRLSDITDDDIGIINDGMTKCSRFLHDEAAAVMDPTPEPDELRQDILDIENWVQTVRRRRN